MRHIGDDLQRITMTADRRTEELGFHAGLIDEIFRRAAAEHDRRGARPSNHELRRYADVADDVAVPRAVPLVAALGQTHADGGVGNRGAEDWYARAVRRGQNAVALGLFPEMAAEQVQKLA